MDESAQGRRHSSSFSDVSVVLRGNPQGLGGRPVGAKMIPQNAEKLRINSLVVHEEMLAENLCRAQADFLGCASEKIFYRQNMEISPEEFEKCFVDLVADKIGEGNWSQAGEVIFGGGNRKNSATIFRQLRNKSKNDKRRNLKLSEAFKMAQYLGTDIIALSMAVMYKIYTDHGKVFIPSAIGAQISPSLQEQEQQCPKKHPASA